MAYVPGGNYLQQATPMRGAGGQADNVPSNNNRPNNMTGNVSYISNQQQIQQAAQALFNAYVAEQEAAAATARLGRVYTPFNATDDVLPLQIETVTKGLFGGNTGSLTTMFTSSNLSSTQKTYYQEIFSIGDPAANSQAIGEFSIAYGHYAGSGSKDLTGNLNNDTPTRAIYRQYAQLLLDPSDKKFTVNGVDTETIYIMNFNRARMREKIDPGNFELTLSHMTGSGNNMPNAMHTGSNVKISGSGKFIQITDDSSINDPSAGEAGLVYNLISGSIDGGINIHQPSSPVYYGLFYPQHGVAILNADTLDKDLRDGGINMNTVTGSLVQGDNAVKLFTSLSSSKGLMPSTKTGGVQARSSEQVKSSYYFVRAKNAEFNYSNNPTFTSGSMGELAFTSFVADPQAYITTVGMYNVKKELLAVAKLSQPLLKNFTREALIKVKLDF